MKISKIYLSPSEQEYNKYSAGDTTEEIQCNRIAEAAKVALERCGFEVKKAPQAQDMYVSIKQSNEWGADLHVPIHTNAGGGSGCVVFVSKTDNAHMQIAQPVYDAVAAITRANETYGVRTANFAEIKNTNGMCIYIECEFHDNAIDAQWIIDHVTDIGEAIAKGICDGAGVEYIAPAAQQADNEFALATDFVISNGIFKGYGNGEYGWGDPLTRGQMARLLFRFYNLLKG